MSNFRIGEKFISTIDDHCFVIGEAGSNHDGSKSNALELIDIAAAAGADAVKFQLFRAETLYSSIIGESIIETTHRIELPFEWIPDLMDRCKSNDIIFLATPFDYEAVEYMDKFKVPAIKWASGEIVDLELLAFAAKMQRPMIISTGMCNISDVENAVEVVSGQGNNNIALLHCISLYPTAADKANLRMMDTLSQTFGYPVGFSDHTLGTSVALASVARGAKILEKHFTLDRKLASPDHPFSLRPEEFKTLVNGVREITSALGDARKHVLKEEESVARIARRSIIARKMIEKGSTITSSDLIIKRPGYGISPDLLSIVIGRTAKKDIGKDQLLSWEMLE